MSPRRHDPRESGWFPPPREPGGPWWSFVRRRTELMAGLAVTTPPGVAWALSPTLQEVVVAGLVGVALVLVPGVRWFLGGQARRLLMERRVRVAFLEIPVCSRSGTVPTVFRSAARYDATWLWVWCPAGITVEALVADRDLLAAACFVDRVDVEGHPSWSNVAVVRIPCSGLGRRDRW